MIAEISCNHCNDNELLRVTVDAAFASGVHAVKLQTSTPECLTRRFDGSQFIVDSPGSPWNGQHLYDLYRKTCTPLEWPINLINQANNNPDLGIIFSTPFSPEMVYLLERKCSPPLYKISSIDWNYIDLIEACLYSGKYVLISFVDPILQIPDLTNFFGGTLSDKIIPLYCISRYPACPADFNLSQIIYLRDNFPVFGFSDHSLDYSLSAFAVSHGATIIEKHFKLNDSIKSEDSHFSIVQGQMSDTMRICSDIISSLNSVNSLQVTIPIGRSLYLNSAVEAGQVIPFDQIISIRPGGGISPLDRNKLKTVKANRFLEKGTLLSWNDFAILD